MTRYKGEDFKQDGDLDVERQLGQGGMGSVWFARNKEDGTAVAIKVAKEVRNVEKCTRETMLRAATNISVNTQFPLFAWFVCFGATWPK